MAADFKLLDLSKASRKEIIHYFHQHQFTDPLGHKLTLNADFLKLVELATEKSNDLRH